MNVSSELQIISHISNISNNNVLNINNNCTNSTNYTSALCGDYHSSLSPPGGATLAQRILLGFDMLVGLVILLSNSLVIIILYRKEVLRGTTSIFLISLSASDLFIAFSVFQCALVDAGDVFTGHVGSLIACEMCTLTANSSAGISTFSLLAISVERYCSVAHPYVYMEHMTDRVAKRVVLAIWWTWLTLTTFFTFYYIHGSWTEGAYCWSIFLFPPFVFYAMSGPLMVAIVVSIIVYSAIFVIAARKSRQVAAAYQGAIATIAASAAATANNATSAGSAADVRVNVKKESKVTQMMALMFGVFILCYTPLTLTLMIMGERVAELPFLAVRVVWLLFLVNSFMNPVIFFWKSSRFRHALKQVLHVLPHNAVAPEF